MLRTFLVTVLASAPALWPQATNPLLEKTLPIPFDRIRAENVAPAADQLLVEARQKRDAWLATPRPFTFQNTLQSWDEIGDDLSRSMQAVSHLESVASSPALRAAIAGVLPKVTAFQSELSLDPRAWERIKEYAASKEARSLTGSRKRLLELTLKRFQRAGADLDAPGKKRIQEIAVELATLSRKFNDNVLEETNAYDLVVTNEAQLAGLPESARTLARQAAKEKGVEGWRFTLQAPSLTAALTYLDDAGLREKLYHASNAAASTGPRDNRELIRRILELRRERVRLVGYKDYADYAAEERMARTGAQVGNFLETLETKTRPAFQKEEADLLAFRRKLEGPQAAPPAGWDVSYYAQKLRMARYDIDPEALRPYFAFPNVMQGLFELVGKLYGVKISKVTGAPVWHPTVDYYEMRDSDGSLLGYFYTDFFARANKRNGAWATSLLSRRTGRPQIGAIVGNLTPPTADRPALLTHTEVQTIFHEFGHLVAGLLNRVEEPPLRNFVWDFVELPSQIMENWTWERACLDTFARHYQTGERIPDSLFQRAIAARNFRAASAQMRQLGLGTVDLRLHTVYDPTKDGDPVEYSRPVMQRFMDYDLGKDYSQINRFLHLFAGGYAAGYYSYKWAEVLDADAFTRFQKEGIFNPKTGMDFRRKILERGNSADAAEIFRDFMGRDPDPDALLRRSGLLP